MKKRRFHQSSSPEILAEEYLRALNFLKKMEGMAYVTQRTLSLTADQDEAYNAVIRHAQEASIHLQAMFDAVGSLVNPTILH